MLLYLRTWLIIKRKQLLNLFPEKEKHFRKFAIICAPRSGSTWLHTLLNSHPTIISYGEILREKNEGTPDELLPVEKLVFHPHHPSIEVVGLKLFYEYADDPDFKKSFQELADDTSICIIHLIREDKTAQYKSLKQAQASQVWSSGKPNKIIQVPIEPVELATYKSDVKQKERYIEELFRHHPTLTLYYEDLRDEQEKACVAVQNFLKVKPRKLFSLLKRQSL